LGYIISLKEPKVMFQPVTTINRGPPKIVTHGAVLRTLAQFTALVGVTGNDIGTFSEWLIMNM